MNGRVFRMDIPVHQAVQELLPWYASAQLAPDETRQVHEHLQACAQCRHALEWEHGMRAEAAASNQQLPDGVDMERALARLMPALGPQERSDAPVIASVMDAPVIASVMDAPVIASAMDAPAAAIVAPVRRLSWMGAAAANQPSWLRWAMTAQCLLIIGLAALLLRPDEEPAYRVLGSGTAAAGNLVVVFHPTTTERELRRILQAQNARVVDGPTVTDAYLLNVPEANRSKALEALRGEAAVKLAEPLDGGGAP
jgi:hypothetical protein